MTTNKMCEIGIASSEKEGRARTDLRRNERGTGMLDAIEHFADGLLRQFGARAHILVSDQIRLASEAELAEIKASWTTIAQALVERPAADLPARG